MTRGEPIALRLSQRTWRFFADQPVGQPGGFGAVYRGASENDEPVAIKQLHLSAEEAAHRELRIAAELVGRSFEHVVPFLDSGQDAESGQYFVVMPLADGSLADFLESQDGPLDESQAVDILRQILAGLDEVPGLVHRDLKPPNVLSFHGRWCIADFGIARFVEESTSLQTLRSCLTPPYAAPEQWRMESPAEATDLYALGCIAHELLSGTPPFLGTLEEIRRQHLESTPSALNLQNAKLSSLVTMLLRKRPETRPSRERARHLLNGLSAEVRPKLDVLAKHGARLTEEAARVEARRVMEEEREAREKELVGQAKQSLSGLAHGLIDLIADQLPTANMSVASDSWHLDVPGRAGLRIRTIYDGPALEFKGGWYVLAGAAILVQQRGVHQSYDWSANLWFARIADSETFRWYEVGYMESPLASSRSNTMVPFSLAARDASHADGSGMRPIQIAYREPLPIDDESEASFQDRWLHVFDKALDGKLRYPRYAPFDPDSVLDAG